MHRLTMVAATSNTPRYIGILLAAGKGSRFDPSGHRNKLLQRLPGGRTVVSCAAKALRAAVPMLAVVPPAAPVLAAHLTAEGYRVIKCVTSAQGMACSLVHGIAQTEDADGWIVALADMPFVQPGTIAALRDALAGGATIAVPVCDGRRGNPVAFARCHRNALLNLVGDTGARSLLQAHDVVEVAVPDLGIFRDIDTPDDLIHDRHHNGARACLRSTASMV